MDLVKQLWMIGKLQEQAKDDHVLLGAPWRAALAARRKVVENRLASPAWAQLAKLEADHMTYWVMSGGQGMRDLVHDFAPTYRGLGGPETMHICAVCHLDVITKRQLQPWPTSLGGLT